MKVMTASLLVLTILIGGCTTEQMEAYSQLSHDLTYRGDEGAAMKTAAELRLLEAQTRLIEMQTESLDASQ